jgi:hypothetical protein
MKDADVDFLFVFFFCWNEEKEDFDKLIKVKNKRG